MLTVGLLRRAGLVALLLAALLLAACELGGSATPAATSTAGPAVNSFGSAANHVHSLAALPGGVLLLATHYGLFRSANDGASWQEVAAGPGQLMDGLMTYALSASPLDPQRLYVLTQPAVSRPAGTQGIYTSADGGRTWQLGASIADLHTNLIFTAAAGNQAPNQVYIYLTTLGNRGLLVSSDAGKHFAPAGALPFGLITGILAIPGAPGHLLIYSSQGMARSLDGGAHWQVITGISGAINDATAAGPGAPIYASGDAGLYVSTDGGASFKLVYTQYSFFSLTSSPARPQSVYGKIGTAIYASQDAGRTWRALPPMRGNLGELAADPRDPATLYLSLSYPTAVYRLAANGQSWQSLTPPA